MKRNSLLKVLFVCILSSLIIFGCKGEKGEEAKKNEEKQESSKVVLHKEPAKLEKVNIYFENSGSMSGYINSITDFKAALAKLTVNIAKANDGKLPNLHLISNNEVFPVKYNDPTDLDKILNPKMEGYRQGSHRGDSKLNEIVGTILGERKGDNKSIDQNDNTVSILISDFIYSVIGYDNKDGAVLDLVGSATRRYFDNKLRKNPDFSVAFFKLNSLFKGTYWNKDEKPVTYDGMRPIYFLAMGKKELLKQFIEDAQFESIGLENKVEFLSPDILSDDDNVNFSIVCEKKDTKKKKVKIVEADGKAKYEEKTIDIFKKVSSKKRQFLSSDYAHKNTTMAVAVRIDALGVDQEHIKNPKNYNLPEDVEIVSVEDFNTEKEALKKAKCSFSLDYKKNVKKPNYILIISLKEEAELSDNLKISLKNKEQTVPEWVEKSSNNDDSVAGQPDSKTTFGLKYFVKGISEAYNNSIPIFSLEIPQEKKK